MQEPTDAWVMEKLIRLTEHAYEATMTGGNGEGWVLADLQAKRDQFIAAYGAWKEAAGAYGVLDGQQCQWDANGQDGCEGRQEDCQSPACRGWRKWKSEYDTRSAALVRLVEGE